MSRRIQDFLIRTNPDHEHLFRLRTIGRPERRDSDLAEATFRVVVARMPSGRATDSICALERELAGLETTCGTWGLTEARLREPGLSRAKTCTVRTPAAELEKSPDMLADWPAMARPCRSCLALQLWRDLDKGYIRTD
jgi:hypothetical protein